MYLISSTSLNSSYFLNNTFGFLFIFIAGQSIQPNWSIGSNQSAHWVYFEHKLSTTSKREKNNRRHPKRWSTNSVQGAWCSRRIHIKEPEKANFCFRSRGSVHEEGKNSWEHAACHFSDKYCSVSCLNRTQIRNGIMLDPDLDEYLTEYRLQAPTEPISHYEGEWKHRHA